MVNDTGTNFSAYTTSGVDNVAVVYANSKTQGTNAYTGIAGINSWLKFGSGTNDNFLLGAERDTGNEIDVTVHPEFKSFGVSSVGTLTEHKLRQYIRRFHAAKNKYGQTIDCLIPAMACG
jgi:hypothetical protein